MRSGNQSFVKGNNGMLKVWICPVWCRRGRFPRPPPRRSSGNSAPAPLGCTSCSLPTAAHCRSNYFLTTRFSPTHKTNHQPLFYSPYRISNTFTITPDHVIRQTCRSHMSFGINPRWQHNTKFIDIHTRRAV